MIIKHTEQNMYIEIGRTFVKRLIWDCLSPHLVLIRRFLKQNPKINYILCESERDGTVLITSVLLHSIVTYFSL